MGIDRPDDADVPPDKHSACPADRVPPETRFRQECYDDLRATAGPQDRTEPAGRSEPGARSKPPEPPEPQARPEPEARSRPAEPTENGRQAQSGSTWEETAELSHWMWTEYKRRWPPEERPPVDRSDDPEGSWRGEGNRVLEPADNARVDAACDRILDLEEQKISPALRAIESQDPDRYLIGLEHCRKGRDRIKEKACDNMNEYSLSPDEAVSLVPDAIRYTFQYDEAHYAAGVRADIGRIEEQGFNLDILKNFWSHDQYKGINSQWIDPESGQRFEVQFHTRISFEAKQLTHSAYERLRTFEADKFEELVLEAFQKKVSAEVPVPSGAVDIPDHPKRDIDAR